jgi:lia operon protein LiaF
LREIICAPAGSQDNFLDRVGADQPYCGGAWLQTGGCAGCVDKFAIEQKGVVMRWFFGILLVVLGFLILGNNVGWFDFSLSEFVSKFWPLILIALGISELVNHSRKKHWTEQKWTEFVGEKFSRTVGDVHLKPASLDAAGLKADQGAGDITIDLTATVLQAGENSIICNLGMGDVEIIVPPNVPLKASCNAGIGDIHIFGRHSDGFGARLEHQDADYPNADRKISLTVKIGLGDIRVSHP